MFDDFNNLENQAEVERKPDDEDEDKAANKPSRLPIFIAMLAFLLLFLPFRRDPWSWCAAVACAFTVFVFGIAFSLSLFDSSDFFGDLEVPRFVAKLLLPHALILIPVTFLGYWWLHLEPLLPKWVTTGHKPPWVYVGALVFVILGLKEGHWLAGKIKHRFPELKDFARGMK